MSESKYYWYVTYSYQDHYRCGGDGCIHITTDQNWFPIKSSQEWILNHIKAKTVVLQSWRRLSARQLAEFTPKEPEHGKV